MGILSALILSISCALVSQPALAADCEADFLGFRPWYEGVCENGEIISPDVDEEGTELANFVWTIVLNISFDISLLIGYIALAMVIYGGFMYIMSQGDPSRAAKGKKTLTSAVIGVVIALSASVIINTAVSLLGIDASAGPEQNNFSWDRVNDILNWAYGMAGVVAVVFIVKSGIDYMVSQGNPANVQKATRGIIFSVVGLIIVIAAYLITAFVINTVVGE